MSVAATRVLDDPTDLFDDYAHEQARIRARILVEQLELPPDDWEDLQQDMLIELVKARKRFNPNKAGRHTFVSRVLDCFCKYYTRQQSARNRRDERETVCSDIERDFSPDDRSVGTDLLDSIITSKARSRLHRAIAALPDKLRRLCHALMEDSNKTAVARALGVSKSTVYRQLATIREEFEKAGIEFFVPENGTLFEEPQK